MSQQQVLMVISVPLIFLFFPYSISTTHQPTNEPIHLDHCDELKRLVERSVKHLDLYSSQPEFVQGIEVCPPSIIHALSCCSKGDVHVVCTPIIEDDPNSDENIDPTTGALVCTRAFGSDGTLELRRMDKLPRCHPTTVTLHGCIASIFDLASMMWIYLDCDTGT
eukprot:gene20853-135_t